MSYVVVDNFVPDPDRARASVLAAGVGTWRPNKGAVGSSIYDGMCFWGDHAQLFEGLVQALTKVVIPSAMFFRATNLDTERAYVHSDRESGAYTCIAYLSQHDERTGTGFYRHRRTGALEMPPLDELARDPEEFARLKLEMVRGSEDDWELVDFVRGEYNRALIFPAPLFHARTPEHGFGVSLEDARLIWCCHYFVGGEPRG